MSKIKRKTRIIVASILAGAILISGTAAAFVFGIQPEPIVNEQILNTKTQESEEKTELQNNQIDATFSPNVSLLTGDSAQKVNGAISDVTFLNDGLRMTIANSTEFSNLGVGDIFYLEGSDKTPLEQTFIGKIESVKPDGEKTTYRVVQPTLDEVFDELHIDTEQILTPENANVIQTLPGVEFSCVDSAQSKIQSLSNSVDSRTQVTGLVAKNTTTSSVVNLEKLNDAQKDFFIEYKIDLLKMFGLENDDSDFQEKYNAQDAAKVKVYKTKTGECYHKENCACVGRSKFEMTLKEAVDEGLGACFLCNPPLFVSTEGICKYEETLEITGKVGLSEINISTLFDWDVFSSKGIENAGITVDATFIANATLNSSLALELGRGASEKELMAGVKLQGLDEKAFPIAYIGYNCNFTPVAASGNYALKSVTESVPLTVGAMIYVDISGNISVVSNVTLEYKRSFAATYTYIENGEFKNEIKLNENTEDIDLTMSVEAGCDVDAHLGASAMVHVFNVNVMELALAKIGAEGEGAISLKYSTDDAKKEENGVNSSYYIRLYLKLLEINVNLGVSADLFGFIELSKSFEWSSQPFKNITLAYWGEKSRTYYSKETMKYSSITAQKENVLFFKDTNGNLVRESNLGHATIYDSEFFAICGIDESYIYLLEPQGGDTYVMHRVSHDGKKKREVTRDVKYVLMMDEEYIYFTTGFDGTKISRLNRNTLKVDTFADLSEEVQMMDVQDGGYYITTSDGWDFFFGGSSKYYLLNEKGEILVEYGSNPEVSNYLLSKFEDFYLAKRMSSNGYLRDSAKEVRWLSPDKTTSFVVDAIVGWNYADAGIFTNQYNNGEAGEGQYKIVVFKTADGVPKTVATVNHGSALFTISQASDKTWYFFDQTDTELILYCMDEDFSNKRVVKTFLLSDMNCNLDECGMVIMENRIYFYTMPDSQTSNVLYRYDIV